MRCICTFVPLDLKDDFPLPDVICGLYTIRVVYIIVLSVPNIRLDLLRHSHSRLVFNIMKVWVLASRSALRTWHIHTTRDISELSALVFSDACILACILDPIGVQTDAVHHHFRLARSARVKAWSTDARRIG